jgi:hypothetical protein
MRKILRIMLFSSLPLTSTAFANSATTSTTPQIQPDNGFYMGLQYVSVVGGGVDVGYQFKRNVALELSGTFAFPYSNALVSVKGILPVSRRVNLYAKLGVGVGGFGPYLGFGFQSGAGIGLGVYATKHLEFNLEGNAGVVIPPSHDSAYGSYDGRIGISWHFT